MPILGIGIDAVEVERIKVLLERYGNRFLSKVFQPEEIGYCMRQPNPEQHLAVRYAVREAVAKALGTGFGMGVRWSDIYVVREANGVPKVRLQGMAAKLAFEKGVERVWISLSHTQNIAIAVAVLEG
jgi:holo-[acyl-carrier protein] synthase